MKHLLNNISEEEKNSIREQHSGGIKLMNEKFQQMVDKKLGHVNLYEQTSLPEDSGENEYRKKSGIKLPAIKSEEDLQTFLDYQGRVDLLYQTLTGLEGISTGSRYEAKMKNILEELLKNVAMICDNDNTCYTTVKRSNIVDNFFKRRQMRNDNVENSRELDIKPKGEGYLKAFKDDFANVVRAQINKLS